VRIVVRPLVCRAGLYSIHIVQALSRHDESELVTSTFGTTAPGTSVCVAIVSLKVTFFECSRAETDAYRNAAPYF